MQILRFERLLRNLLLYFALLDCAGLAISGEIVVTGILFPVPSVELAQVRA